MLAFKEVDGLEHVSFQHSIVFCSFKEQGDLLHLLKCHARALDGLDRLVGSIKAVDEFTQHLKRNRVDPSKILYRILNGVYRLHFNANPTLTHPSLSHFWKPVLPSSGRPTPDPHWAMIHCTSLSSSSGSYFLSILL